MSIEKIDQAGWYKSKALKTPEDNIALTEQPLHRPERNPVEHIWDELREKLLNNKIHQFIEDLIISLPLD